MAPQKDKQHASPNAGMGTKTGSGTNATTCTSPNTGTGTNQENGLVCSLQDIWGFLSSMQTTIMKQSEDIKNLALKNQELEHKNQTQDMKIMLLEEKIQMMQTAFDKKIVNVQDTLTVHDEKFAHMNEKVQLNVQKSGGSWANIVREGHSGPHTTSVVDDMHESEEETEYHEQEKRKMNIVVRGINESDTEQVLTLNTSITDMISNKFGMHDVVVYGAHRVGKKKLDTHRAIVCTLLDARKRAIILENARIYLKDSPLYVSEDRTPKQQKARREAYEERMNKKASSSEDKKQAP